MDIISIRHTKSTNNKTWTKKRNEMLRVPNSGLTELGRTQARALANWSPGFTPHPTQLFSSPFIRILEVAALLAESLGMSVAVRADLMGRSGPFVGPVMKHRHHPGSSRSVLWEVSPRVALPDDAMGGDWQKEPFETRDQAIERARDLVTWLCRDFGPDDYVMLANYRAIGSLFITALSCPSELARRSDQIVGEAPSWFTFDNTSASWSRLFPDDDTELRCFNHVDHLVPTGVESVTML